MASYYTTFTPQYIIDNGFPDWAYNQKLYQKAVQEMAAMAYIRGLIRDSKSKKQKTYKKQSRWSKFQWWLRSKLDKEGTRWGTRF